MLELRKPTVRDVSMMHKLMAPHVRSEVLLPRSQRHIVENLRDYVAPNDCVPPLLPTICCSRAPHS